MFVPLTRCADMHRTVNSQYPKYPNLLTLTDKKQTKKIKSRQTFMMAEFTKMKATQFTPIQVAHVIHITYCTYALFDHKE